MISVVRASVRHLLRSPWFSVTAVLSVGVSIGLAGSVYSVVHAAFFTPLPYGDPSGLVEIWQTPQPGSDQVQDFLQPVRLQEWVSADARTLAAVAGSGVGTRMTLDVPGRRTGVEVSPILGDWFGTLRVQAARGRALVPGDLIPDAEHAAVVSEAFRDAWLTEGLGEVIELSGTAFTVVGVMPRGFEAESKVWVPSAVLPEAVRPMAYAGIGRLRPGATIEDAGLEIRRLAAGQVEADSALFGGFGATVRPLGFQARSPNKPMLWLLSGVVLTVLLVGLTNLTQLFLIRAQKRSPGLAVRASLGGTSWQIGRGLLAEAALVGFSGAGVGLALAVWGKDVVRSLVTGEYAVPVAPTVGWPVVALALGLGGVVTILAGIEPIRRVAALDLQSLLQRRAAGSSFTPRERRTRNGLVAVQVATCVVLAASAGVLRSAYRALGELDVGYDVGRVVQALPTYQALGMEPAEQWALAARLSERLRRRPEIDQPVSWHFIGQDYPPRPESAAIMDGPPVELGTYDRLYSFYKVTPGFFSALGIDLVRGRPFGVADGPTSSPVTIVTARAAAIWWPGMDPLGRQVRLGEQGAWMTVIGIAEDIQPLDELGRVTAMRSQSLPLLFVPTAQMDEPPHGWRYFPMRGEVALAVRASGAAKDAAAALKEEIAGLAPELPVQRVGTLYDLQMAGHAGGRMTMGRRLLSTGTAVALLLAIMGIAGVVAEGLTRRSREIGVRMALGARAHHVVRQAAAEGLLVTSGGLALGCAAVVALDRTLSRIVFDYYVQRLSEGVLSASALGVAAALVTSLTVGTAVLLATRATRVEPAEALRSE